MSELQPQLAEARYDLSDEEIDQLVSELLEIKPPSGEPKIVCYRLDTGNPAANVCRSIEQKVFQEAFKGGHTPTEIAEMYNDYEDNSQFFLSIDRETALPVGALRLMYCNNGDLTQIKTLADLPEGKNIKEFIRAYNVTDSANVCDIGTVAVMPEYRNQQGEVSGVLYGAMYATAISRGVEHFVSVIQNKLYKQMREGLGIPFEPLLDIEPFEYHEAFSQFAYGKAKDFMPSVRVRLNEYIRLAESSDDFDEKTRNLIQTAVQATSLLAGKAEESFQFDEKLTNI